MKEHRKRGGGEKKQSFLIEQDYPVVITSVIDHVMFSLPAFPVLFGGGGGELMRLMLI